MLKVSFEHDKRLPITGEESGFGLAARGCMSDAFIAVPNYQTENKKIIIKRLPITGEFPLHVSELLVISYVLSHIAFNQCERGLGLNVCNCLRNS